MDSICDQSPRLRRIEDEDGLCRYEVSVDGVVFGIVGQERSQTVHAYAGSRLGYKTTRTTWMWETPDNCGDYEMRTRNEAVASLIDFVGPRQRPARRAIARADEIEAEDETYAPPAVEDLSREDDEDDYDLRPEVTS